MAPSTYYEWREKLPTKRQERDTVLLEHMQWVRTARADRRQHRSQVRLTREPATPQSHTEPSDGARSTPVRNGGSGSLFDRRRH